MRFRALWRIAKAVVKRRVRWEHPEAQPDVHVRVWGRGGTRSQIDPDAPRPHTPRDQGERQQRERRRGE